MNLRPFTDNELTSKFSKIVRTERKITLVVLMYIAEIDRRKVYLKNAYPSLFEFLTKGHGYSPSAAQRRIDSARLLREIPEVAVKVHQGSVNLSQLSKLQQAVRLTQKTQNRKVSSEEKVELINKFENTTHQETEKILSRELLMPVIDVSKETYHRDGSTTLTMNFTAEQMQCLQQAREVLSHAVPSGKWSEIFLHLVRKEIKSKRPKVKSAMAISENTATAEAVVVSVQRIEKSREEKRVLNVPSAYRKAIPSQVRKNILSTGGCTYRDPVTGAVCGSKKFLQVDHIVPVWVGGDNSPENLRPLCGNHNRWCYRRGLNINTKSVRTIENPSET